MNTYIMKKKKKSEKHMKKKKKFNIDIVIFNFVIALYTNCKSLK